MLRRFLTTPAVHFIAVGAILFASQRFEARSPEPAEEELRRIVVTAQKRAELRDTFLQTVRRPPNPDEERALIDDFVEREILYHEALRRRLDEGDRSVRFRLIQKMKFLDGSEEGDPDEIYREALGLGLDRDDLVIRRLLIEKMRLLIKLGAVRDAPPEDTLRAFFDEEAEDYRQPARVSLTHVYWSNDKRRNSVDSDALALLEALRAENVPADAGIARGDVFPLGHEMRNSSRRNLAKLFGPDFAAAAIDLPLGEWSGPVPSAYGRHLVWVGDRIPSRLPDFDAVESQLRQRYLAELRERELARAIVELRENYDVVLEDVRPDSG